MAARAGTDFQYAGSDNLDEVGWYGNNSDSKTHPVAQKKPNGWGLYDMSGNVLEWCNNPYGNVTADPYAYRSAPVGRSTVVAVGTTSPGAAVLCSATDRVRPRGTTSACVLSCSMRLASYKNLDPLTIGLCPPNQAQIGYGKARQARNGGMDSGRWCA